ncbi:hypothetical protein P9112_010096 [Eukaryota sp. TZLM1-RC]
MYCARKATVIIRVSKESSCAHNIALNHAVLQFQLSRSLSEPTGRESVSRYVEALKLYAQHMSAHVMSDMTIFQQLEGLFIYTKPHPQARYRVIIALHRCSFQTNEYPIKVLGSIFENGQRRIDPTKIESITKLAPPTSISELW